MIQEFAKKYRLHTRRDTDGTDIIPGKLGHLYEYCSSSMGMLFLPPGEPRTRLWNTIRQKALAAGMVLRQDGDAEGALSFQAANPEQARLAIRLVKVRAKRNASPAQLANLTCRKLDSKSPVEGHFRVLKTPDGSGTGLEVIPRVIHG